MADWFDRGLEDFHREMADEFGVELDLVRTLYYYLSNEGFIDYDTEKELIYERYGEE